MASSSTTKNMYSSLVSLDETDTELEYNQPTSQNPEDIPISCKNTENKENSKSSVIPFKSREVVELRKNIDTMFPNLEIKTDNTPKKSKKAKRAKKPKAETFIIASSYNDVRNSRAQYNQTESSNKSNYQSQVFAKTSDKEELAKTLQCTRACNYVTQKTPNGNYGVCYRQKCSFAHSLDELKDPFCRFNESCRFKDGKILRDGSIDVNTKCKFRHTGETRDEWVQRTGSSLPDLPQTNENTRKPTQPKSHNHNKTSEITSTTTSTTVIPDMSIQACTTSTSTSTPKTKELTSGTEIMMRSLITPNIQQNVFTNFSDPQVFGAGDDSNDSDTFNSFDCSNRHKQVRRRNRRSSRSRSPRRSPCRSDYSPVRQYYKTISVPTMKLAEIAIKAAMDQKCLNLRIVIE